MATKGTLIFRGDLGSPKSHYAKTTIEGVTDDAALVTLMGVINSHTYANMAKRIFSSITPGTDEAPELAVNVDRRAVIYFRHPTSLKVHSITIPGINAASCEGVAEGERVTQANVVGIVAAIATATGVDYTALYGVVEQKR